MNDQKNKALSMVYYIKQNITYLSIDERREVLQIIINSSIEDNKIQSKGNGTQVKFKDLHYDTIQLIYTFIQNKIAEKTKHLNSFTEENVTPDEE